MPTDRSVWRHAAVAGGANCRFLGVSLFIHPPKIFAFFFKSSDRNYIDRNGCIQSGASMTVPLNEI